MVCLTRWYNWRMSDDQEQATPASEYPIVTNKAGQSFVVDGEAYKMLPNGAVHGVREARIVANPNGGLTAITPANSSDVRSKLFERRIQSKLAAGRGMAQGTMTAGELEAWERINAAQASLAVDTDRGRASTEAARFVGAAAGFLSPDTRYDDQPAGPAGVRIELSDEAVDGLIALVAAWHDKADEDERGERDERK